MNFFFLERASTSNFCCATNQKNPYIQVCLVGSIASFTTLWKILLVGTPHTPCKFLPFSPPPHPLGISIDHLGGRGMDIFWNHTMQTQLQMKKETTLKRRMQMQGMQDTWVQSSTVKLFPRWPTRVKSFGHIKSSCCCFCIIVVCLRDEKRSFSIQQKIYIYTVSLYFLS